LSSLSEIHLEANAISYLENEAFNELPRLKELHLFENRIAVIRSQMFSGVKGLNRLFVVVIA
jgi:hypothetical protein